MSIKPAPPVTAETRLFWARCAEGVLAYQRCTSCGRAQFYPRAVCTRCQSDDLAWEEASGRGTIYSFTVVHRAPTPAFRPDVPYVIALVDLEEGVRIMANLLGAPPEAVAIGMAVRVVFEARGDGVLIPQVEPDGR